MNPLMQVFGQPSGKFRVGQKVRLKYMFKGLIGEIVEDRGNIGGYRFYNVKVRVDPWNEHTLEEPEESLEEVVDDSNSSPKGKGKRKKN